MAVYSKRYPFCAEEGSGLTLLEAERAFHLLPDPPKVENLNDYIVMAVNGNENGFAFFLHAYEERLNRRIRGFLLREGFRNTEPDRLFEYKQACVQAMLEVLPGYDPNGGASFLTYAHHDIENAMIGQRKNEEGGSFASLDEYKAIRKAGRLYRENHEKTREAVKAIAEAEHCSEQTAVEAGRTSIPAQKETPTEISLNAIPTSAMMTAGNTLLSSGAGFRRSGYRRRLKSSASASRHFWKSATQFA